jgi:hypothetical protein
MSITQSIKAIGSPSLIGDLILTPAKATRRPVLQQAFETRDAGPFVHKRCIMPTHAASASPLTVTFAQTSVTDLGVSPSHAEFAHLGENDATAQNAVEG